MLREEGRNEEQVHGQTGAAAHERNHQHSERPVPSVLYLLGGHNRGYIASEAYQHRDEGASVQAHEVHDLVHKEGRASHIAGVLKQGEEEEHNDYVRQEGEHRAHALHHSVRQHAGEPARRHHRLQP